MTALLAAGEVRMTLDNVGWQTFVELAEQKTGSAPRLTYDDGVLELMNPRRQHENIGRLIGRLVETYSEVRNIEIQSVASTTFKRPDLKKAFEADESYYVEHAEQIRPKEEVDLAIDPPPDLVIEVAITKSGIDKLGLFAAMGIPEVWIHDGQRLSMFRLQHMDYRSIEASESLPGLTSTMVDHFLATRFSQGETALIRQFRQMISAHE